MKNIVTFCGKTTEATAKGIDETQTKLKQNLYKDEDDAIPNTNQINENATKKNLKQCKYKKCNYLNRIENLPRNQVTFINAIKTD